MDFGVNATEVERVWMTSSVESYRNAIDEAYVDLMGRLEQKSTAAMGALLEGVSLFLETEAGKKIQDLGESGVEVFAGDTELAAEATNQLLEVSTRVLNWDGDLDVLLQAIAQSYENIRAQAPTPRAASYWYFVSIGMVTMFQDAALMPLRMSVAQGILTQLNNMLEPQA